VVLVKLERFSEQAPNGFPKSNNSQKIEYPLNDLLRRCDWNVQNKPLLLRQFLRTHDLPSIIWKTTVAYQSGRLQHFFNGKSNLALRFMESTSLLILINWLKGVEWKSMICIICGAKYFFSGIFFNVLNLQMFYYDLRTISFSWNGSGKSPAIERLRKILIKLT